MERQRKERLVGAAVLIMLAVIFIPMVLDNSVQPESGITGTNIPPQPEGEFASRVIPLTAPAETPPAATVAMPDKPADAVTEPAASVPPVATTAAPSSAPASPASAPASAPAVGVSAWVVQLGSFASAENAESLNQKLRKSGYSSFVEPLQQGATKVFRVRVGPELRRSSAQTVRDRLQANMALDGIVVPYP